jgi:hypothetical protein
MLNSRICTSILMYDVTNFRKLMRLSPNWRFLILEGMDEIFKPIEVNFINKYFEHLEYKRSYTNSSVIFSGGRAGLRLDRVLVCEVLSN